MIVWLAQTKRGRFLYRDFHGKYMEVLQEDADLWETKTEAEKEIIDACYADKNLMLERCKAVKYRLEPFGKKGG